MQAYTPDAIARLLSDVTKEAALMMLFLKSLQSLQVGQGSAAGWLTSQLSCRRRHLP
jgi:hypothetical protein